MLHYVHQLVANFVCLLFGARQVVYSGFLELFRWTQLPAATENKADESGETVKNRTVKLQGTADLGDNSLWFLHYKQHILNYTVIWPTVNIKLISATMLVSQSQLMRVGPSLYCSNTLWLAQI